jgi:hypothetical protein
VSDSAAATEVDPFEFHTLRRKIRCRTQASAGTYLTGIILLPFVQIADMVSELPHVDEYVIITDYHVVCLSLSRIGELIRPVGKSKNFLAQREVGVSNWNFRL